MKFLTTALALTAGITSASAAACNADNCARAVTGTLRAQSSAQFADCQSALSCTYTPAVFTVTVTTTGTVQPTSTTVGPGTAVTHCPTKVPAYASGPCSGIARYSSACSCFGATGATSTAPTPTTTVTFAIFPTTVRSVSTGYVSGQAGWGSGTTRGV